MTLHNLAVERQRRTDRYPTLPAYAVLVKSNSLSAMTAAANEGNREAYEMFKLIHDAACDAYDAVCREIGGAA